MNRFYQIPTDKYVPISHENSYLFTHYEKISNFLAFSLESNYKKILAKPVQQGYVVDWFSTIENLQNTSEKDQEKSNEDLKIYWEFIEKINSKIQQLSSLKDENSKNWASLLSKIFNHQNNQVFSNGSEICIVWGWKFNSNDLYKPNLISNILPVKLNERTPNTGFEESSKTDLSSQEQEYKKIEDINEFPKEENQIENLPPYKEKADSGFINFLKWFASKFWWLLWILLLLIVFILLFKSCNADSNCDDVNNRLLQLENKANNCLN